MSLGYDKKIQSQVKIKTVRKVQWKQQTDF